MATDKMQVLCIRARLQSKCREPNDLKELLNGNEGSTEQQFVSGHGVCEYMGATHSSQHTVPDAQHDATCCCPTHEMWELPTPLIVANRSQQGDEVRELPAQPQQHPDYTREMSSRTSPASSKRSKVISKRRISARGVQRYQSYFNRSCIPSAIGEDKARADRFCNRHNITQEGLNRVGVGVAAADPDHASRRGSGRTKIMPGDDQHNKTKHISMTFIGSTTGDGIPSSACTRRPDEIGVDGFSSSRLAGTIFRRAEAATASNGGGAA
ncbi:rho GTPase-activating protein 7-like [Dorcoceras hygrometricum]|uniref:Rho GTPase-activating protein 7-like n=1 Tax=Dorcoceras hygrometricum TaxID=472368 RepID=A0A2Z7AAN6_9LAMI|nr:rho GTPase-activating protein 7-like [Dorcoceras hygrometricum]